MKIKTVQIIFLVKVNLMLFASSNGVAQDNGNKSYSHLHSDSPIHDVSVVKPRVIETFQTFIGIVEVDPDKSSQLNPRYPGIVQTVSRAVGEDVKSGDILAKITSNTGFQTYPLKANISGRVVHRNLAVGEFVDQDRLAFAIANLDSMWVNVTIRQGDLRHFKIGQEIVVLARNDKSQHITGNIFYISPVLDQSTMSATATVRISNKSGIWKPGQYVNCYMIMSQKKHPLTLANDAVLYTNKGTYVVKKDADGNYVKLPVEVGKSDLHHIQIINGLVAGDQIALNPDKIDIKEEEEEKEGENEGDEDKDSDESGNEAAEKKDEDQESEH